MHDLSDLSSGGGVGMGGIMKVTFLCQLAFKSRGPFSVDDAKNKMEVFGVHSTCKKWDNFPGNFCSKCVPSALKLSILLKFL